jgi:hypothetical protein
MRIVVALLFSFFVPSITLAQYFSGDIEYKLRVVPKKRGMNVDSLMAAQPGTEFLYKIAEGYYKAIFLKNGKEVSSYTYHGNTKRMYDEMADKDIISYRDSRRGNMTLIRSRIYKDSVKTIASHKCFLVERVYGNQIIQIYYATDLKINHESFAQHAVGDWYNQIKEVNGALGLSSMTEYATHYEYYDVVKVTKKPLKASDFALPAGKAVIAGSGAVDQEATFDEPSAEIIKCYEEKITATPNIDYTCYVGFIVDVNGKISHVEAYEEDEDGLYKVAVDIVQNCGLHFQPGTIDGKTVDSWVYFPIKFGR